MAGLQQFEKAFSLQIDMRKKARLEGRCLWPERYAEYTPEACMRFLTEQFFTLDPSVQPARIARIPPLPHIEYMVQKALHCRTTPKFPEYGCPGLVDVYIKGRRMIVSWTMVGLNLWEAGLLPGGAFLWGGLDWPKTGDFIYRFAWGYNRIAKESGFGLPELRESVDTHSVKGPTSLSRAQLPNGSFAFGLTMERPDKFIQEGLSRAVLEEVGKAMYPGLILENVEAMCKPPPGMLGGNATLISTAMPGWYKSLRNPVISTLKGHWPRWEHVKSEEQENKIEEQKG